MPGLGAEPFAVKIEGIRELTTLLGLLQAELPKELGERNKRIGAAIIAAAFPKPIAVGAGAGAVPRPSADKNILQIRAGGSWRHLHVQQWGRQVVAARNETPRPFILGAAQRMMPAIEREYMRALVDAGRKVGLEIHGEV